MSPKKIINRELSWLQFNDRVLSESTNPDNPLLERGKFISITTSNLDEFFMVRVGSLFRNLDAGSEKKDAAGMTAQEQLEAIRRLYELDRVETLPDKLKETIILRETYPELTLSQLAQEFDPPVSKSCLSHRLRKLVELSKQ